MQLQKVMSVFIYSKHQKRNYQNSLTIIALHDLLKKILENSNPMKKQTLIMILLH